MTKISTDLPDFEAMVETIDIIHDLAKEKMLLEVTIRSREAQIVIKATHVLEGKPPSMDYIKNSIMVTGFDGELIPMRERLADVSSELEKYRSLLDLQKSVLDVWRTRQANERSAVL